MQAEKTDKRNLVIQEIRRQIVRGKYRPGALLPTRSVFETEHRVSRFTIQQAFDRLRDDGFIQVAGRRATYVAKHPPHLSHYALLFPTEPSSDLWLWPQSWQALIHEADALQQVTHRTIHRFYGIHDGADHARYRELDHAIRSQRLAGLIFANRASQFGMRNVAVTEPDMPRVAITSGPATAAPMPQICRDYQAWFDRALQHMAQCGRTRVAALMTPWRHDHLHTSFEEAVARHRLQTRPYWTQIVHPSAPQGARLAIQLIFSAPPAQRPDGLLIADDNLLSATFTGLLAADVRVPEDVTLIAHAAFPRSTPDLLPITRLGFSAREVLRLCVQRIDQQRQGKRVPHTTAIRPIFEHESATSSAAVANASEA